MTATARRSRDTLLADHRARMLAALAGEERVLETGKLSGRLDAVRPGADGATASLESLSERNMALCGELISDGSEHARKAQPIAAELSQSISALRAALADAAHLPAAPSISSNPSSSTPAVLPK